MNDHRLRVLLVAGYFDWFSGYQETVLARGLSTFAETHVVAGNRASPIFSDENLERIGQTRIYAPGTTIENSVRITRLSVREHRSMVWSSKISRMVTAGEYDLVIQVMPGQLLPAAASLGKSAKRVALYGDNAAMYANLPKPVAFAKFAAFAATKGVLYTFVNRRAMSIYGYTPDTLNRLRWFSAGHSTHLLPLAFDQRTFKFETTVREVTRTRLGINTDDILIISAGKVQPQKRLDALIGAMAVARKNHPNLRLLIAGMDETATSRGLRDSVDQNCLGDIVQFSPFVNKDTLNTLFNAADIGVWPAMPAITIQQAMGTGLTVLIPQNDFISHLIRDRGSAISLEGKPLPEGLSRGISVAIDSRDRSPAEREAFADANAWLGSTYVAHQLAEAGSS